MLTNRISEFRYNPAGVFEASARHTARLAIEEVLAGTEVVERSPGLELPEAVPAAPELPASDEKTRPRIRRRKAPLAISLIACALALASGAMLGSGTMSSQDRFNADRMAAQAGSVELYQVPEVHGHPGSAPTRERSGSIREFLGMASAF